MVVGEWGSEANGAEKDKGGEEQERSRDTDESDGERDGRRKRGRGGREASESTAWAERE